MTTQLQDCLLQPNDSGILAVENNAPESEYRQSTGLNVTAVCAGMIDDHVYSTHRTRLSYERNSATSLAMQLGTAFHAIMLQPELVDDMIVIYEGGDRRGKKWLEFKEEHEGKIILKQTEAHDVFAAASRLHGEADLLKYYLPSGPDALRELAVWAVEGRMQCKGKIDGITLNDDGTADLIDLKTTQDVNTRMLKATARKFCYREKLSMYARWYELATGIPVRKCRLAFCSLQKPYAVRILTLSDDAREWGTDRMLRAIAMCESDVASNRSMRLVETEDVFDVDQWEAADVHEPNLTFGGK